MKRRTGRRAGPLMRRWGPFVWLGLVVWLAGCQPITPPTPLLPTQTSAELNHDVGSVSTDTPTPFESQPMSPGITHFQLDGNRTVRGVADFSKIAPLDVPLDGVPVWVVAAPIEEGTRWAVALDDGRVQVVDVVDGAVVDESLDAQQLPAGMPPVLHMYAAGPQLLLPDPAMAPVTHAVPIDASGGIAFITADGDLYVQQGGQQTTLPVSALPDARILVDARGRLLLLTHPTTRYAHGVLGDGIEAAGITLVETHPSPRVVHTISIPEPRVIEGIAPIWIDWDGDGQREIIVTLSDAENGAQLVLYSEDGVQLAAGPAIGRGGRWRHQLAVAPFGSSGEMELADVLTPHIGGVVEFYEWRGDDLVIVARLPGYTSHVIGTRNLDMGVAGDFDADGQAELLLPDQARRTLNAIVRTGEAGDDAARVVWSLDVGGQMMTNLAAASLEEGQIAIGVGRSDGVLRIWAP